MKKAQILICDDELGVRESLKLILGQEYAVAFVTNGAEAVAYMTAHDPDLALLDLKMPKMDGLEALQQIKVLKPRAKVVILTGYESSDVAAQAIRLGATDFLTKPLDRAKVLARVRALLNAP